MSRLISSILFSNLIFHNININNKFQNIHPVINSKNKLFSIQNPNMGTNMVLYLTTA